jgi:pimeloyl-ACP methyl ester carboxylesterase/NAD(P)-dependent dehydrogenase (short-subunit alcohol dehydrogenase family)
VAVPAGKSYLIAGGCGGVGLALARVLADAGARRLILFGRSEPSASASAVIEELRTRGVDCTICRGDVTVPDDVARAVAACGDSLAGVIHAAGVVHDAAVPSIDPGELQALLAAKTVGARNLHEATAQRPLDFFVLCSSLSSVVGSPGQGAYSAANAYLDCLAWHRRSLGLPALSINWGPWDGIGMTAALPESARVRWADRGIAPFSAAAGAAMFLRLAASRYTQISAAIIDWTRFHRTPEETAARQSLPAWLHSEAARILKVGVADLPLDRNLMELGFDSLMVMELLRALHRNFHIRAYPREFYQNPSVAAFAACLSEESAASACTPARLDIPIAFLLSAPRSGSTLLRVMLAGHPGVFCPPELHLLGYKTMRERDTALKGTYLQEGLLRALQELLPNGTPEAAKALEQEWIAADLPIQTVYAHLAEMAGGRLLIDKSPSYAGNRETLRQAEEIFANARYVHLLRHPLSVIDSFVKNRFDRLLGLTGKPPREAAEEIWIESNANVADLFRSVDRNRTNTLRYEDLVGHPAQAMGGLCAFLGLPFDEAVLRPYEAGRMTDGLQAQSVGIGDPNFLNHRDIDPSLADAWRSVRGDVSPKARALAAQFQYELPQTSASSTISEQRIAVRGLSLCLCTWGPPDGAPVFIVHGALDHAAAWEEVALALAARGFRVFAPDQRGHGLSQHVSPEGSYHLMDFLADADTILRQVTAAPVTLVGHSMGASLAALLAAARPGAVKKLIMVEPLLAKDRADRNNSEILSAHLNGIEFEPKPQTFADADKATQRLREFHPSLDAVQAAKMAARLLQPCPEGVRWRWDERVRSLAGIAYHGTFDLDAPRFLSILSEIAIPVTLVRGTGSEIVPREQIIRQLDALRDGREAALPGGHNLHLDCPAELARIIAGDVS